MTRTAKLLFIPILLLQLGWFIFIAQHRFVDGDEGYFLLASRLVLLHKKPYLDFFFQQAPLLPYFYALWLRCFHVTWASGRILPALLTSLLGLLLYQHICRETGSWLSGVFGVALFSASTLTFAWMPIAKPYSLAGLFLFAAYVLVSRLPDRYPRWRVASAGFLLALAMGTRSYLVLTTPLFLWWIYRTSPADRIMRSIAPFVAGLIAGLLPCVYFFAASPSAFLFDNLGYHAIRTDAGLLGLWGEKLGVLLMLSLGGPEGNGVQNALLFLVSLGFVLSIEKPRWPPRFAFQLALLIGAVSLLPTPVLPQYFCFCIPFLVVSAVCVAHHLTSAIESRRRQSLAASGWVLLACVYLTAFPADLRKYLVTGDGIPAVRGAYDRQDWRLDRVLEVSRTIDALARPGEVVASFWPGYIFQTKAAPFPGLETDCGLAVADKLNLNEQTRFHIVSWQQIEGDFGAHLPRVVVVPNHQSYLEGQIVEGRARRALLAHGYTLLTNIGDTSIYICCSTIRRSSDPSSPPVMGLHSNGR